MSEKLEIGAAGATFQERVQPWMLACFGEMIAGDREERNHRFLEEALELVQSTGCTSSEAHQLVDYVYGRPVGEPAQEVGGVMVTLAALCLANNLDMHADAETELARIWTKVEQIRAKQAAKPKHSPLPTSAPADAAPAQSVQGEALSEAQQQKLAERVSWTTKQWYDHVGAREDDKDQIVFGSVMALRAMLVQFQAVTLYAAGQRASALALERAAQACDQQADGTNGAYRTACLQCANAVRELRDAALAAHHQQEGGGA
ncbi:MULTISPECIES: hypothetical protein [unclassified Duganella]|uniref:hypothetical protein n=1 Tax=unclassified Duganella TaxID=2636909 RepID=UPI0008892D9C|nr:MULTISPECIES: hypothetical protein [unclassified Duganella]SDF79334.1 hypothetical protein SAMN05216320_1011341 [Duganella sp. OV458]SDI49810.1 hypothetical protein SAMN05428973_10174 [Duganella sp. OV510]